MGETEALHQELSISTQELAISQKQLAKLDETSRAEIGGLQACNMHMHVHGHGHGHGNVTCA